MITSRTVFVVAVSVMTLALLAWASPGTLVTVGVTIAGCALVVYRVFYYTPKRKEDTHG